MSFFVTGSSKATSLFATALLVGTFAVSNSAHADAAGDLAAQADAAFAARDFDAPGVAKAQQAADMYAQAAAAVSGNDALKGKFLIASAKALYFVADASDDNNVKINVFLSAETSADQGVKLLGLADVPNAADADLQKLKTTLKADQLADLGEGLYERGAALGQWGQSVGVLQSLSKWPELRHNMEIMDTLGVTATRDFGAYRILGRGYAKIPSLLGGDMNKAKRYLQMAVNKTKVAGQIYSKNGTNNIYLADVLHAQGVDDQATALLNAFIKADPASVDPTSVVDVKHAQQAAQDDLKTW